MNRSRRVARRIARLEDLFNNTDGDCDGGNIEKPSILVGNQRWSQILRLQLHDERDGGRSVVTIGSEPLT